MITDKIRETVNGALKRLCGVDADASAFQVNETKPEFEGDYTVVLFALVKSLRKSPDQLGQELGADLVAVHPEFYTAFNVIKGFLNLTVADAFWLDVLTDGYPDVNYGKHKPSGRKVMVEYSSPNTNKPLHLGHLRNNFLGWSIAEILKAGGHEVVKSCVVNDRGIHICKSMIAWQMFGNGATPESTGIKGDHLVGDYYVRFNDEYKKEIEALVSSGKMKEEAEREAPIMKAAQEMLVDWEAGDPEVLRIWNMMNSWVYAGFHETYKRIGSDFERVYYESQTYLLGKKMVDEGLSKGVFVKKDDGSVWIDLTADGLDEKIVQRRDGTAVYITQDIGLAIDKYNEYKCDESIYVVGDEQNYHFKVLKLICEKLGLPSASGIYHLSYGMVELPTGKMKSREGTVVDADDIVQEMVNISAQHTQELGKVKDFTEEELAELYETLGLGALKFFLLRVDPKKKMVFNPEESIDTQGNTATFIQYVHARIKSILRKADQEGLTTRYAGEKLDLESSEKELVKKLNQFTSVRMEAATQNNPGHLCNYVYDLAKTYNKFYTECPIFKQPSPDPQTVIFRLWLNQKTADCLKYATGLLGIGVPEKM
jgi:arginyl-tRNA synthetase